MADEDTNAGAGAIPDDQDTDQTRTQDQNTDQSQQQAGGNDLISQALAAVQDTVNYTRDKYGLSSSGGGGSPDVIDLSGGDKSDAAPAAPAPNETSAPSQAEQPQGKALPDEGDAIDQRFTSDDVTHSPDVEDRRDNDTSTQPAADGPVRSAVGAIPVVGPYINQAADTLANGAANRADQLRATWQGYTNPMSKELGYDDIGSR